MNQSLSRQVIMVLAAWALVWLVATPYARGQTCDAALHKIARESVHALECRELHDMDDALRTCKVDPQQHKMLELARWQVKVALDAHVCASAVERRTCDATIALAERLRQSADENTERLLLWNLVATQLLTATGVHATNSDRECASHMIAIAVSEAELSELAARSTLISVIQNPELHDRFIRELVRALKDEGAAGKLAKMLADGIDLRQILQQASQLSDEEKRRFFRVAGGLGRVMEAVRALSAFEQTTRGLDMVITPRPRQCRYADFTNTLLAGLTKAVPARVAIVNTEQFASTVDELLASRSRSCGSNAPEIATGPGCGAVIAVEIEERTANRGGGQAYLHFVISNGNKSSHIQNTSIRVPDFQIGCGAKSEESAAALRLVFDLQFAFATSPRESAVVMDRPVRSEACGLRALPPSEARAAPYDLGGLRIRGPELDATLAAPAQGVREALRAWKYGVGDIDGARATASLRLSSETYRDEQGNEGQKLSADLVVRDQQAASFAAVVLRNDRDCRAPFEERYLQAGRMLGNEAGSFLARGLRNTQPEATVNRHRWIVPVAAIGDLALATTGLVMLDSAVKAENRAVASGADSTAPNNRLAWGRGLLVTAAAGAIATAIYASVR